MVIPTEAAQKAARKAIEKTYQGVLSVTEHTKVKDEITMLTGFEDLKTLEGCPCKLSYERLQAAALGESAASVLQAVKLFLAPDIVIKAGSKLTVTQAGVTTDYTSSGVPAVYPTHQEIILDLFERWA